MNAYEREVQRRVTKSFIDADSTVISLTPRVQTTTPAGAQSYADGTPRKPQRFKLSMLAFDQRPVVTVNGVERTIDYHLIGLHDAQVAVGDWWMEGNTKYEVVGFSDGMGYETKAFVVRHVPRNEVPS